MALVKYHVVLNKDHQSEDAMRRIVQAAGLVNVNESRARFFDFSIVTADGSPAARLILESLPEVKAVKEDGEKRTMGRVA